MDTKNRKSIGLTTITGMSKDEQRHWGILQDYPRKEEQNRNGISKVKESERKEKKSEKRKRKMTLSTLQIREKRI